MSHAFASFVHTISQAIEFIARDITLIHNDTHVTSSPSLRAQNPFTAGKSSNCARNLDTKKVCTFPEAGSADDACENKRGGSPTRPQDKVVMCLKAKTCTMEGSTAVINPNRNVSTAR